MSASSQSTSEMSSFGKGYPTFLDGSIEARSVCCSCTKHIRIKAQFSFAGS